MRRLILVGLIATAVITGTALASSTPVPILSGPQPMSGAGFGQVKPRTIYLGGDESGLVCRIQWLSWGGQIAVGTGTALYVGPRQITAAGHWAPTVVTLFHLGTWHGRPAYKGYKWYFPGNGAGFGQAAGCKV